MIADQMADNIICVSVSGGASLDLNSVEAKPRRWILDMTWLNLVQLSSLHPFTSLLPQVAHNDRAWRAWFDEAAPEEAALPDGYDGLVDAFRKLLLIRSWCPDRTIAQVSHLSNCCQDNRHAQSCVQSPSTQPWYDSLGLCTKTLK